MRAYHAAQAHPALAQLLEDDRESDVIEAETPVLLGDCDAEEAHPPHRAHELRRVDVIVVVARRDGRNFAAHEVADEAHDLGPGLLGHSLRSGHYAPRADK